MLNEQRIIEVYRLYSKELFVYIFRLTANQEVSEELLQDCFENLIKYAGKYGIEDFNIRAFLYKTAHNLSVNHLKRRKKIDYVLLEEDGDYYSPDRGVEEFKAKELQGKIYQLLERLDEKSRSLFILCKENGLSNHEAAEVLHVSERTVRRKMADILEYLEAELRKTGYF